MNEIKYDEETRRRHREAEKRKKERRKAEANAVGLPSPRTVRENDRKRRRALEAKQAEYAAQGKTYYSRAEREAYRRECYEAAHTNPDKPAPVPVTESRIEKIVNDQRRSSGGVVRIESGSGK